MHIYTHVHIEKRALSRKLESIQNRYRGREASQRRSAVRADVGVEGVVSWGGGGGLLTDKTTAAFQDMCVCGGVLTHV